MPFRCSVSGCNGNYDNGSKVRVYSFPKDEQLAAKWLRAIKRDNFKPTSSSRVRRIQIELFLRAICYIKVLLIIDRLVLDSVYLYFVSLVNAVTSFFLCKKTYIY